MKVDMPMKFAGSPGEQIANYNSHQFDPDDARCRECDCRPWGRLADWPCGAEVPRVLEG